MSCDNILQQRNTWRFFTKENLGFFCAAYRVLNLNVIVAANAFLKLFGILSDVVESACCRCQIFCGRNRPIAAKLLYPMKVRRNTLFVAIVVNVCYVQ